MKYTIKKLALALSFALSATSANAALMGDLRISSQPGQPLSAEIDLLNVSVDDSRTMSVTLATTDEFKSIGATYSPIMRDIVTSIVQKPNGNYVILVNSTQPTPSESVDIILKLTASNATISNKYTIVQPESAVAKAVLPKPPSVDDSLPTVTIGESKKIRKADNYTVVKGDTLNKIARDMAQGKDVSLDKMMIGIYNTNKSAFINNNINLIKTGKQVNAPTDEVLSSITELGARKQVALHIKDWKSMLQQSAVKAQESTADSAVKAPAQMIKPEALSKLDAPEDRLSIKNTVDSGENIRNDQLEEELATLKMAEQESKERVSLLESQLNEMKALAALKDQELNQVKSDLTIAQSKSGVNALLKDTTTQLIVGGISLLTLIIGLLIGVVLKKKSPKKVVSAESSRVEEGY